ncbi:MAG: DEAD/DEAH box helicase family protein [Lachnospiraceae bacterium]|nr:DEAD/DEAH box helicase family protein [Lachnospiraceae bacterium]
METESLYQWQEECLKRWLEYGGRGMVQAVTGSGKTRLALCAIDALEKKLGRKVLVKIVVPTNALMRQWAKALRGHLRETKDSAGSQGYFGSRISPEEQEMGGSILQDTIENRMDLRDGGAGNWVDAQNGESENQDSVWNAATGIRIGLRGGGIKDSPDCRYMIYVINSARYELARQILTQIKGGEAVFLIADECHHYAEGENHLIFEFLTRINIEDAAYYSLGLSATLPGGEAGRALAAALGPRIYSYGMEKASAMKTVCPFDIFHVSLSFDREEQEKYEELSADLTHCFTKLVQAVPSIAGAGQRELFEELQRLSAGKDKRLAMLARNYLSLVYKRKNLVCVASARILCATELIRRLDPEEKILVFGERISQAEELYRLLSGQYPGRVGHCHSRLGDQANRNNLERFRTGEFRILLTCRSMDEGVDIPDASVGIILSGTSTQRQRAQRLGRIIRKKEGKERAALFYLHIEETMEDTVYLPDTGGNRIFELAYDCDRNDFVHPSYEEAAWQVIEDIRNAGADNETLCEAFRCLDMGCVRSDWTSEPDALDAKIRKASDTAERNYWVCMKRIAGKRRRCLENTGRDL